MKSGRAVIGLGMAIALMGCGDEEPGPGSKVGQEAGGAAGMGGAGGVLVLPDLSGASGGGAGGASGGGAGGTATQGGSGGSTQGGSTQGGSASGGKSGGGSGGSKPVGMCKRVASSDATCVEFWEDDKTQAHACDDAAAYVMLNNLHDGACASTSGIPGGNYGACCPP